MQLLKSTDNIKNFPDQQLQEGLAAASIARDDLSTLPGDDPFPCARMHHDRGKLGSEYET